MKEKKTLCRWLIEQIDGEAYRAGRLAGKKHFSVDASLIRAVGGREPLLAQARELERDAALGGAGKIVFWWRDLNADIRKIDCAVDAMPKLCRRERIEDPRMRQLRYLEILRGWQARSAGTWLATYYEEEIEKLERGKCSQTLQQDMEDGMLYRCLDAILHLREPVEKPIFSARVFQNVRLPECHVTPSKVFRKRYEGRVVSILKRDSDTYFEGMSDDEVLAAHGILSYAQTLEWKGPLAYVLDDGAEIDTSRNRYGTILGAQTLEHAAPKSIAGVKRVLAIENKANFENRKFREDELYIFCHGFFAPKEVRFLKKLTEIADPGTEFAHWGDLDYGGIRIFQFNQRQVFSELKPYKMGRGDYEQAIAAGAGVPLESKKREKLAKMDAGDLEELKTCILEHGMEVEQELLI